VADEPEDLISPRRDRLAAVEKGPAGSRRDFRTTRTVRLQAAEGALPIVRLCLDLL
jgi:hypothetical protein